MRSIALLVLLVAGCQLHDPDPVYPPAPLFTGDVDSACANACANLRRFGCPEGYGSISAETCERRCVIATELRSLPLVCWAKAQDVFEAKGCGSLRCIR